MSVFRPLCLVVLLGGCAAKKSGAWDTSPEIRRNTSHLNIVYSGFGSSNPSRDAQVVREAVSSKVPAPDSVLLLVDTVPDGVTMQGGALALPEGSQLRILGKFSCEWRAGTHSDARSTEATDERLRALVMAAGGDTAVVTYAKTRAQGLVRGAEGWVIHTGGRSKSAPTPAAQGRDTTSI
jgi:hypothetical protein